MAKIKATKLMAEAADLLSVDGENTEYDRAIVELTCRAMGIPTDDRDIVEIALRRLTSV